MTREEQEKYLGAALRVAQLFTNEHPRWRVEVTAERPEGARQPPGVPLRGLVLACWFTFRWGSEPAIHIPVTSTRMAAVVKDPHRLDARLHDFLSNSLRQIDARRRHHIQKADVLGVATPDPIPTPFEQAQGNARMTRFLADAKAHTEAFQRQAQEIQDEARAANLAQRLHEATQRANRLADECQTLRDENTKLLAEVKRLERGRR